MKTLLSIVAFCLCTAAAQGQTQLQLNQEAQQKYLAADKELNQLYQQILFEYKEDKTFIENLRATQRLWIKFRDAELNMKYPDREPGFYGSIQPMCVSLYLEKLTLERIHTLQLWAEGAEEGDGCGGSEKIKP